MSKLNFTGAFFKKRDKKKRSLDKVYENGDDVWESSAMVESFIEDVCNIKAPVGSDKYPVAIDMGGIILFLIFEGPDQDNAKLIEGFIAINRMGVDCVIVPNKIGSWIVNQYMDIISKETEETE